jgi:hypothetical protein
MHKLDSISGEGPNMSTSSSNSHTPTKSICLFMMPDVCAVRECDNRAHRSNLRYTTSAGVANFSLRQFFHHADRTPSNPSSYHQKVHTCMLSIISDQRLQQPLQSNQRCPRSFPNYERIYYPFVDPNTWTRPSRTVMPCYVMIFID